MSSKLFSVTDANRQAEISNVAKLNPDQAAKWVKIANKEYKKMKDAGNIEMFSRARAIRVANEMMRKGSNGLS